MSTLSTWIDQYFSVVLKMSYFYNVCFLFLLDHYSFDPSLLASLASWVSFVCLAFSFSSSPVSPTSDSFVCEINKLFNFFKELFNTAGIFRLSMLFFRSPAIVFTICRIASVTNPSVSSCGCSELTVSTRVWNINRNLCTSCSLISISSSISLILSSIFWFSNLIFFLSWFSESSYLNSELESSLMVSSIDLLALIALVLE